MLAILQLEALLEAVRWICRASQVLESFPPIDAAHILLTVKVCKDAPMVTGGTGFAFLNCLQAESLRTHPHPDLIVTHAFKTADNQDQ